ncbi:DUF2256 domain-containing protein [Chitinilyticum litopenaei]|uniref:DUF2256 domain-containing protein n=1 Tax=Chitinilyticum litopenaei TaxID=1121276 RepID=UPI0027E43AF1|nr:DUF2256 domain-containing protein [Chitinilyticum litopenaei]
MPRCWNATARACVRPRGARRLPAPAAHNWNWSSDMQKSDLPSKLCPVCQRPFSWRRKWAKDWDAVRYCSERCRRRKAGA